MTMWTPYRDVDSDISDLPGIDLPRKRRRSRGRAWRDGLADQTVVREFEDIRAYRAFERALIGSVDPRSAIELALVHRLANLLWRLRRASAIETALFEIQGEALLVRRAEMSRGHLETLRASARANGHDNRTDRTNRRPTTENRCQRPRVHTRAVLEIPRHRSTISAPFQS
jgi:hypothetical protein